VLILKPEEEFTVRQVHAKYNNSVKGDDLLFEKTNTRGPTDRGQYLKIKWEKAEENIDASKAFEKGKPEDSKTCWDWLQEYLGDREWHKKIDVIAAGELRNHGQSGIMRAQYNHRDLVDFKLTGFGSEKTGWWRLK
jgi:hypothetical protein